MSTIVSCSCGARVRLPEERLGKMFRCPRCKVEFLATADARVVAAAAAAGVPAGQTCPTCQTAIGADEVALTCPECGQVHHRECWAEVGGCSTYGCQQAPAVAKPEDAGGRPLSAWGDTKTCPVCGEKIKAIALKCRYCGTDFDTVDPLNVRDLARKSRRQEGLQGLRTQTTILFVVSFFGCIAPLVLIVNLAWFIPKRHEIAKAGPLYPVLGYASLGIAVLYTLLIAIFLVFWRQ